MNNNNDLENKNNEPKKQETTETQLPKFSSEVSSIGELKKDTQKSPLAMIILFAVLIATIFFIPYVTPYFSNLLAMLNISSNEDLYETPTSGSTTTNEEEEQEVVEPTTTKTVLTESATITFENLIFKSFRKTTLDDKYYITYEVNNNNKNAYSLLNNKVYIDCYDVSDTYIGRILIETDTNSISGSIKVNSIITEDIYNKLYSIEILTRTEDDYPAFTLSGPSMTCQKDDRTIEYTFKDYKLIEIEDLLSYAKTDEETYSNDYILYQNRVKKLNESVGVSAVFVPLDAGFNVSTTINYEINDNDLTSTDSNYYKKDTDPKVINYELESKGYNCN